MSTESRSTDTSVPTEPAVGPLAQLDEDEALRCENTQTGWRWYYTIEEDGEIRKYHEYHDYAGERVTDRDVAFTIAFDCVECVQLSRTYLAADRGELDD